MSAFVVFAIIVTLLLLIYYAAMITWDLRKLGKQPSSSKEEFDVSSMQEEEGAFAVDETQFRLPDAGEEQMREPQEQEQQPVIRTDKPSAAVAKIMEVQDKMESIGFETTCSAEVDEFADLFEQGDWVGGKFRPKF